MVAFEIRSILSISMEDQEVVFSPHEVYNKEIHYHHSSSSLLVKLLEHCFPKYMAVGCLKVSWLAKTKVHVSIWQFADDVLFCKNDEAMVDTLIQIIGLFERCSGPKVNWDKSALYGVNIDEATLKSTTARINCKVGLLSFIYLGLPLGGYPKQHSFWQPIIDKVHSKLDI